MIYKSSLNIISDLHCQTQMSPWTTKFDMIYFSLNHNLLLFNVIYPN